MCAVAVVAITFAVAPTGLAVVFSTLLVLLGVVSAVSGAPWFRIAAWATSCYPILLLVSLYTTLVAAWYALGHQPRPSLDDPKFIGPLVNGPHFATWMLLDGFLPVLLFNAVLGTIEFVRTLHAGRESLGRFAATVGPPMLSWPLVFLWIKADPGDVFNWFMD